jgi:hypothetical protein
MTRLATLAAGACALTLASACGRRGTGYAVPTPAELQQQLAAHDSLVIVDVREPAEFAARHIPGAHLIRRPTCEPVSLPHVPGVA